MTLKEYTHQGMKLTGVMTKKLIKDLRIPFNKTKMHGVIRLPRNTINLYEVPTPYNKTEVFYGSYWDVVEMIPNYYFTSETIKDFNLTPIGENEEKNFVCRWAWSGMQCEVKYSSLYDRKNEEKYRLRFLTDPAFDPHGWEYKKKNR